MRAPVLRLLEEQVVSLTFMTRAFEFGRLIESEREKIQIKATILPVEDISKIKQSFGEYIRAAIRLSSVDRRAFADTKERDIVDYNGRKWEIVNKSVYNRILPYVSMTAVLVKDQD